MAKARVMKRNTPRVVHLDLTEGEADAMLGLTAFIGGDEKRSPRKYVKRVRDALERACGYVATETDFYKLSLGRGRDRDVLLPRERARADAGGSPALLAVRDARRAEEQGAGQGHQVRGRVHL